ncbi:hypothetical protein D3C75_1157330 [compost metagenome]
MAPQTAVMITVSMAYLGPNQSSGDTPNLMRNWFNIPLKELKMEKNTIAITDELMMVGMK